MKVEMVINMSMVVCQRSVSSSQWSVVRSFGWGLMVVGKWSVAGWSRSVAENGLLTTDYYQVSNLDPQNLSHNEHACDLEK